MKLLRARRTKQFGSTRHRAGRTRRPALEPLEARALLSAFSFTRLADAVNDPFQTMYYPGVNDSGDVVFGANLKPTANPAGLYLARGGTITTIAQTGAGFSAVDANHGMNSINASGVTAFVATGTGGRGIYLSDGTAPTLVLSQTQAGLSALFTAIISDSGAIAFSGYGPPPQNPSVSTEGIFLFRDGVVTPIHLPGTTVAELRYFDVNNNGQVVYFAYDDAMNLTGGLYVSDGVTRTTIAHSSQGFSPTSLTRSRFSINDNGTVAFTGQLGSTFGVFTSDGTTLTTIASSSIVSYASATINNAGDVAFLENVSPLEALYLYDGESHATARVVGRGDVVGGKTFGSVPYGIDLSDTGRIALVATLSTFPPLVTYLEVYRIDPVLPALSIGDATVTEGNAGTTAASFTVTLSGPSSKTVTVHYTTADGSATTGDGDYSATGGTLTFAPGETSKTITVLVNGDTRYEPGETFSVLLSDATRATILDDTGTGTILNDDPFPSLSINSVAANEGNSGGTPLQFAVVLSNPSSQAITVDFATVGGSASSGVDFAATSGTLTFAPGEMLKVIVVQVVGDTIDEDDEAFQVVLSNPVGAAVAVGTGVGTILDDDAPPQLTINDVSLAEGNAGTTAFTFTVGLSQASGKTVSVGFATTDGTANADGDYTAASGTLTFAPGETAKAITVLVHGDTAVEPDETFLVHLGGAANAAVAVGTGVGTILNDDSAAAVSLAIDSVTLPEGHAGTTLFAFTVSLSAPSAATVTVNYATANGTARFNGKDPDYVRTRGTLSFAPGQTSQTIVVPVHGDAVAEPDETFLVHLSGAVNAAVAVGTGVGTILNDDILPGLSIDDVTRFEGHAGTTAFVFTVSLSAPSASAVTVRYATANGSAVFNGRNADYAKVQGRLTFAPGETSQTITVLVQGDTLVEPDETFSVDLSAPDGATILDGQGVATILNDDGASLRLLGRAIRPGRGVRAPTGSELSSAVDEALAAWRSAGLDGEALDALARVPVRVVDLPGDELARAVGGGILIDRDAAGWGWSVGSARALGGRSLGVRRAARLARGRVDLPTALAHEFGHLLGRGHAPAQGDLMHDRLARGTRRLPGA